MKEGKHTKMVMGLETLADEERLKGLGSFSPENQGLGVDFIPVLEMQR